jgi:hypothetical protein
MVDDRTHAARHEAGHAVVASCLGRNVKWVDLLLVRGAGWAGGTGMECLPSWMRTSEYSAVTLTVSVAGLFAQARSHHDAVIDTLTPEEVQNLRSLAGYVSGAELGFCIRIGGEPRSLQTDWFSMADAGALAEGLTGSQEVYDSAFERVVPLLNHNWPLVCALAEALVGSPCERATLQARTTRIKDSLTIDEMYSLTAEQVATLLR